MKIEVVNLEAVIARFAQLGVDVTEAAEVAARTEAQHIFARHTQHLVPWETGQLHASGRVEAADVTAGDVTVGIAYGGPAGAGNNTEDVDYALIVHEDLAALHLFGRQAKYVEDPVRQNLESGASAQRMSATIKKEMGW